MIKNLTKNTMFANQDPVQDLASIQARIAAVARGLQSNPDNAIDYAQALEIQVMLLNEVIYRLNRTNQ